jgi:hypothetical protein
MKKYGDKKGREILGDFIKKKTIWPQNRETAVMP